MTATTPRLSPDEFAVLTAVDELNRQRRTTNNSQIASCARVSRTSVRGITVTLRSRKLIVDTGPGGAYHWRMTPAGLALLGGDAPRPGDDLVPAKVTAYFERKREGGPAQVPVIVEIWGNGSPWQDVSPVRATLGNIRELDRAGARSVAIVAYGSGPADFTTRELLEA
jgi:hypothetical protein